jgi:tRNA threonylcarbamoyladenosine biosynthesis protein TsaB
MIVLALDTATREASVALTSSNRRILAQASATVTTHSERLLGLIDRVMRAGAVRLADVTAVVCGCGPGSFTGLRIGLATAKGLCFAAGRPLCCVSSLDALGQVRAAGLVTDDPESIYALLDARRGQLYWRRYDGLGRSRGELTIGAPAALADEVAGGRPLLVGEGALVYREALPS